MKGVDLKNLMSENGSIITESSMVTSLCNDVAGFNDFDDIPKQPHGW